MEEDDLQAPADESDREPWVLVATYRDLPEAHIGLGILESRGLTPKLTDEFTVGADWLMSIAIGGVGLGVPVSQAESARQLLEGDSFEAIGSGELPEELRADPSERRSEDDYFEARRRSKRVRAAIGFLLAIPGIAVAVLATWAVLGVRRLSRPMQDE